MWTKILQVIVVIGIFTLILPGQDIDYLFQKANDAYQQENYTEAIKLYESIVAHGKESGELYYNLGNAYYKTDQIGRAILFYEKAKILMPDDENLDFNLKLANVKVKDRIQVPPDSFIVKLHQGFINLFSLNTWALLFSLFVLFAVIVFLLTVMLPAVQLKSVKNIIFICLILAIISLYPTWKKYQSEALTSKAVVLEPVAEVYAAPDAESTMLFNIHEGTTFSILDSDGNWYKIELIDGKQGWIPRELCGEV